MEPVSPVAHVIELTHLPACEPNISHSSVLRGCHQCSARRLSCAWIAYDAKGPDWPNDDDVVALVRVIEAVYLLADGPNDEAFRNHRFYPFGLELYRIQEIVNSPWIEEVLTMLDKDRSYPGPRGLRHFVFALKETTVDCVAESAEFVGLFPTHQAAMAAAQTEIGTWPTS